MEQGIIYRATEGIFRYIGWPTVAKDENGVIYAVCSGHRLGHICPFGKNYMFRSVDDAESWEGPIIINDTPFDDRDAGLLPLGDGKMLLTWFINTVDLYTSRNDRITKYVAKENVNLWKAGVELWQQTPENELMFGSFIKITEDGGKSWSEPIEVPVSSPHGPIKLKDGRLLYFGCLFDKKNDDGTNLGSGIAAYESRDNGLSWELLQNIDLVKNNPDIFMCEPYQTELPDGTLIGVIRVHEDPDPHKFCIYKVFSYDGGKSWTKPEYVCPGSPPHLMLHSSGALIMTYTIRDERYGQRARISYDGGKTFGDEIILCENAVNWDSGYCSSVELSDGSVYTVYYQKADGDNYCSLMYTKWNLPK